MTLYEPQGHVPLPPPDAKVLTTACDYCIVGCGYKVYVWPTGEEGGPSAELNAFAQDFPAPVLGRWVSPNQHNIVSVGGRPHNVVVAPDFDARYVNPGGNHSIRGGTLALKCFNPDSPTADRLTTPLLRVNGALEPVSWDDAIEIMARVSEHVVETHGAAAWAMKTYSYEFFENTYAITKLAFDAIATPAFAQHDKPSMGSDTGGMSDAGIITFSASYEDWGAADVIFVSGTDPFESKTVLFTSWMLNKPLVIALPRRTAGVAHAEAHGGVFLQLRPGTDTLLHMAISRIILENGWQDDAFVNRWVASSWDVDAGMGRGTRNTPWQWRTTWGQLGTDFEGYRQWILENPHAEAERAAEVTGVGVEKMRAAAALITGAGGPRPKASFAFEKGNYWSNNYLNTASYAALGLLCGAGNRPGRVISRLGGHQRGWIGAAPYPRDKSPEKLPGRRRIELDLDRWVAAGNVRFAWVIGTTWSGAMAASQELARSIADLTAHHPRQVLSARVDDAVDALIERADSGGMVLVDSDIYPVEPINTQLADLVLPAAAWGEHDATRCNGERRLRLYSAFYDPPGEAKPDWWAIGRLGQAMGFEGFDWQTGNDVFEEAARASRGGVLDYSALVWRAGQLRMPAHELLRQMGTDGIQTPVRWEDGELRGTIRLHDSTLELGPPEGPTSHPKWLTRFKSHTGKALFLKSPWELFDDFYERITPDLEDGELWLTTGRVNEIWQSGFDSSRKPVLRQRWPDTFVEIHPDDARAHGIESGDWVRMFNDDILIQTGGWLRVHGYTFSDLAAAGLIKTGSGEVRAVAIVTDNVLPGVLFTNFLHPSSPANALVHRVPDPLANVYRYKLGKARVEGLGPSEWKDRLDGMSFKPRTVT